VIIKASSADTIYPVPLLRQSSLHSAVTQLSTAPDLRILKPLVLPRLAVQS